MIQFLPTAHKIRTIKNALLEVKPNAVLYVQDYFDTFLNSLNSFKVDENGLDKDKYLEIFEKKIDDLKAFRDNFIDFTEMYLDNSLIVDVNRFHGFFEKLLNYFISIYEKTPETSDHFRFFSYELFLNFISALVKKERFDELAYIIQTPFLVEDSYDGQIKSFSFEKFRQHVEILNKFKKKKFNLNRVNIVADTFKERASLKYDFDLLRSTDLLLYYLSILFPAEIPKYGSSVPWFPETSCYRSWGLKILPKTVSEKYFNRVKIIFGVSNKTELMSKAEEIKSSHRPIHDGFYQVPDMAAGLQINEMCTLK